MCGVKDAKGRGPSGTTRAARVAKPGAEFSPSTTGTDLGSLGESLKLPKPGFIHLRNANIALRRTKEDHAYRTW